MRRMAVTDTRIEERLKVGIIMSEHRAKLHAIDGLRKVLVVEDEAVNRAILGEILSRDYEVLYAEDGEEALEQVRANADTLEQYTAKAYWPYPTYSDLLFY